MAAGVEAVAGSELSYSKRAATFVFGGFDLVVVVVVTAPQGG